MDVRQLRYFAAVVEAGSLSKAALKVAISQPSLSQQIAEMEDDMGVPLLLRSWSGVRPTEAGLAMYRHAQTILRQLDQMRTEVRSGEFSLSGQVAIGLPTSVATVIAVPLFDRMRSKYPGIQLQIIESMSGNLSELLANGRLDMAILFRETETRGITVTPLFTELLSVHGAAWIGDPMSRSLPLSMMSGVPLVLPGRSNGLRLLVERVFAAEGLELNVAADIDSLPTMLSLARRGSVATILSGFLTIGSHNDLPARYLVEPTLERTVALCRLNSVPQTAASLAVQDCIQDIVKDLAPTLKVTI